MVPGTSAHKKSEDTQVTYIKYYSICVLLVHILFYTLRYLLYPMQCKHFVTSCSNEETKKSLSLFRTDGYSCSLLISWLQRLWILRIIYMLYFCLSSYWEDAQNNSIYCLLLDFYLRLKHWKSDHIHTCLLLLFL